MTGKISSEISGEVSITRTRLVWFLCAMLAAPICYFSFQLLNTPELATKISEQIIAVEIPNLDKYDEETKLQTFGIPPGENYSSFTTLALAVPHAFRSGFLVMILVFPAIKFGLLFAMVLLPITLGLIGTCLHKLSKVTVTLSLLSAELLCVGIPFVGILTKIILDGKWQMILP